MFLRSSYPVIDTTYRPLRGERRAGGRRSEPGVGRGADDPDPLGVDAERVDRGRGDELRVGAVQVDGPRPHRAQPRLARRVVLDEVLGGIAVRDDVVQQRRDRQPGLGDRQRDRVERDRVQVHRRGEEPRALVRVSTDHAAAEDLDGIGGERLGHQGAGSVVLDERDRRRTDRGEALEDAGDVVADPPAAGGRVRQRAGVDEQALHGRGPRKRAWRHSRIMSRPSGTVFIQSPVTALSPTRGMYFTGTWTNGIRRRSTCSIISNPNDES